MALEIKIISPKVGDVLAPYEALEKKLTSVGKRMQWLSGQANQMGSAIRSNAKGVGGGGSASVSGPSRVTAPPIGYLSPANQARMMLSGARAGIYSAGSTASQLQSMAQRMIATASTQKQMQQAIAVQGAANQAAKMAAPSNPWAKIQKAAYSTRFGAGGAMPLVGQTLDILGLGKFAGPVAIAATAVTALAKAADGAASYFLAIAGMKAQTGGTSSQAAKFERLAYQYGMDPGSFADAAKSLESASGPGGDPRIRSQLQGLGIRSLRGYGRNPNRASNLQQLLDKAKTMDPVKRKRLFQDLGLEDLLPMYDNDPKTRGAQTYERVKRAITDPIGTYMHSPPKTDIVGAIVGPWAKMVIDAFKAPNSANSDNKKALDNNTAALNQNNKIMQGFIDFGGGGTLVDSAIPREARYTQLSGQQSAYLKWLRGGQV